MVAGLLLSLGCATPIGVRRVDERTVHRTLSENVLSTGRPSVASRQVLLRLGLYDRFARDPEGALARLHELARVEMSADRLFALAEYSELLARARRRPEYHMAAAAYAYAFLLPEDHGAPPDLLDPRVRAAADLYNRALANALIAAGGAERLAGIGLPPFVGDLELRFDASSLRWAGRRLGDFVPTFDLEVRGLRNRYRRPGIGAAFAASAKAEPGSEPDTRNSLIAENLRIPVSFFLRFESPRDALRTGDLRGSLELYNARDHETLDVDGRSAAIEYETSAALALSLDGAPIWDTGIAGFRNPARVPEGGLLRMWGPHRPGRVPVVLVHGTASSPARWAEMLNELESDAAIRENFEFWFFTYPSGSPILYSAELLRAWLRRVVAELDPQGRDASLSRMVLIGHSQGGLLAKLQVVASGARFWNILSESPFDEVKLAPETRELLGAALFFEPLPFVRRVIFIATPQRGSFVAASWRGRIATSLTQAPGRLVELPLDLARAGITLSETALDLMQGEVDEVRIQRQLLRLPSSVDNMNPANSFITTLAEIRIEPPVIAHSIIPVTGGPPPEGQNDGVVEFESASIEEARSELVVFRAGHSAQSHPEAIQEVRRILLEHLDEG